MYSFNTSLLLAGGIIFVIGWYYNTKDELDSSKKIGMVYFGLALTLVAVAAYKTYKGPRSGLTV